MAGTSCNVLIRPCTSNLDFNDYVSAQAKNKVGSLTLRIDKGGDLLAQLLLGFVDGLLEIQPERLGQSLAQALVHPVEVVQVQLLDALWHRFRFTPSPFALGHGVRDVGDNTLLLVGLHDVPQSRSLRSGLAG